MTVTRQLVTGYNLINRSHEDGLLVSPSWLPSYFFPPQKSPHIVPPSPSLAITPSFHLNTSVFRVAVSDKLHQCLYNCLFNAYPCSVLEGREGGGGEGKEGESSWSLPMSAKAQVNVEPVFRDIRAGHGSQARALSCGPSSSSSSSSSFSSFILHPPLGPAGPGAGTEVPLLCTRGSRLFLSLSFSFPPLSLSLFPQTTSPPPVFL